MQIFAHLYWVFATWLSLIYFRTFLIWSSSQQTTLAVRYKLCALLSLDVTTIVHKKIEFWFLLTRTMLIINQSPNYSLLVCNNLFFMYFFQVCLRQAISTLFFKIAVWFTVIPRYFFATGQSLEKDGNRNLVKPLDIRHVSNILLKIWS